VTYFAWGGVRLSAEGRPGGLVRTRYVLGEGDSQLLARVDTNVGVRRPPADRPGGKTGCGSRGAFRPTGCLT
jgi:hypothetical protein